MNVSQLKEAICEMKICSTLYHLAEDYIFNKPEEECFTPFTHLIGEGWEKHWNEHPSTSKFEKGVYVDDDSEYIGHGIVYAGNHIDVSKMLPNYPNIPEEIICEFRYDLALNYYEYMRYYAKPTPHVWNVNTLNWNNLYDIVHDGKKFGKTLTM